MIALDLPLRTRSEANVREHWAARAKRVKSQRNVVTIALRQHSFHLAELRAAPALDVLFVRVSPRRLDDDNLRGAMKAIRDAVATWIGVDDGQPWWTWRYEQRHGAHGARIEIAARAP